MGRYYCGDIEGKFMFGVQASDDASFFGGEISEPSFITYYFDENDIDKINEGIEKCMKELGENKEKLDAFFDSVNSYNDQMISQSLGIAENEVHKILEWYARLLLGQKIQKCVAEKGSCSFDAEC